MTTASLAIADSVASLLEKYRVTRRWTEALCRGLALEDYVVQSMPDASPVKWHLAHTTWFFEEMVLAGRDGYRLFHPGYGALFNSYYDSFGPRWARAERGLLSRPTVSEVLDYRRHVDAALGEAARAGLAADEEERGTLGLDHEQQQQELLLADLKH